MLKGTWLVPANMWCKNANYIYNTNNVDRKCFQSSLKRYYWIRTSRICISQWTMRYHNSLTSTPECFKCEVSSMFCIILRSHLIFEIKFTACKKKTYSGAPYCTLRIKVWLVFYWACFFCPSANKLSATVDIVHRTNTECMTDLIYATDLQCKQQQKTPPFSPQRR